MTKIYFNFIQVFPREYRRVLEDKKRKAEEMKELEEMVPAAITNGAVDSETAEDNLSTGAISISADSKSDEDVEDKSIIIVILIV